MKKLAMILGWVFTLVVVQMCEGTEVRNDSGYKLDICSYSEQDGKMSKSEYCTIEDGFTRHVSGNRLIIRGGQSGHSSVFIESANYTSTYVITFEKELGDEGSGTLRCRKETSD